MTTKLQPYLKYKDAGIEWIKKIPADWQHDKIVSLFNFPNDKVSDVDFEPLSVTYGGIKKQVEDAAKTDNGSNRKLLKIGDIAFNGRSDRRGACGASDFEGSISVVYHVLRKKRSDIYISYFHHLFRNTLFSQEFYRWGKGIHNDMWMTRTLEMKRIQVPVPPFETQRRIADFLGEKTKNIDKLILKNEKMIKLLREKRTSLITHTITKGYNKNAKLIPSGVSWLGNIPEEWVPHKIKYLISRNDGGVWGESDDPDGTPVLRSTEVSVDGTWRIKDVELAWRSLNQSEIKNSLLIENDLLMTKSSGSEDHIGKTAIVNKEVASGGFCYSNFMQRIRPKSVVKAKLLYYFFNSQVSREQYKYFSTSTTGLGNLTASLIENLFFILIPENDQATIVDFLDAEVERVNETIKHIELQINQFKEYRTSLIYSAVTGKIKV